ARLRGENLVEDQLADVVEQPGGEGHGGSELIEGVALGEVLGTQADAQGMAPKTVGFDGLPRLFVAHGRAKAQGANHTVNGAVSQNKDSLINRPDGILQAGVG